MAKKFKELRKQLTEKYGKGKYKIFKDDSVHVHSVIPGTGMTGFWFLGWANELERIDHGTEEN